MLWLTTALLFLPHQSHHSMTPILDPTSSIVKPSICHCSSTTGKAILESTNELKSPAVVGFAQSFVVYLSFGYSRALDDGRSDPHSASGNKP